MKHESAMIRGSTLLKNAGFVLVPALLAGLLALQMLKCGSILDRRNAYLLEDLPGSTRWVWDALSGQLYPYLYAEDDQPGGRIASRQRQYSPLEKASPTKSSVQESKVKWRENIGSFQKDFRESVLIPGMPSLNVHYLWCVDGHFELSHYIAILSALHQFRPDKMTVHYVVKPRSDPKGYWRWLEDLERDIAMLSLKPLKSNRHCSHDLSAGITETDFPGAHGVFILGDVAITNLTRSDITKLIAQSFVGTVGNGDAGRQATDEWSKSQVFVVSNSEPFRTTQDAGRVVVTCPAVTEFNTVKNLKRVSCVSMQSYLDMDEMLRQDTRFYRFVRSLLYGSPDLVAVPKTKEFSIPSIYHVILRSPKITPLVYVGIKSAFVNGKVTSVYVHCHEKPHGEMWDRLVLSDNLSPVFVQTSPLVSRQSAKSYLLYTLLQHGGVASLGDAIFIKPWISSHTHPAVISPHRSQYRQTHRTLNTAVLAAVPGSEFIKSMLGTVQQPNSFWPDLNPDDLATHLSEVDVHSVFVDSSLVTHQECDGSKCLVAGGHDPPQNGVTTRLLWKRGEPNTLRDLASVQGPLMRELHDLIK